MSKTRINISLDEDLADFAKIFAAENRTSVAEVITQYLLTLKRRVEGQDKLRNGTAKWHSYEEVFGD